jgi:hypothetical protein
LRTFAAVATFVTLSMTFATAARAASYSGLKHACKYTYGVGDYQSVSAREAGQIVARSGSHAGR